jgi:hypothetical protein
VPTLQLKHNHGNVSDKIHMTLIQSKDVEVERLLRNRETDGMIKHTK